MKMTHVGKYSMFLDWKNQYCEYCYTNPVSPHIQCNPYLSCQWHVFGTRTKILKTCMDTRDTKEQKQSWARKIGLNELGSLTWAIIQSYCLKNSMVLAQK